uniref:Uncharacterized protein n=1 Tax=Avena sativa TaxID=4498 RepID=A0ACD5ZJW7_AVESA
MATATLRWVVQMHRDVPRAARFYAEGLDFGVNVCTLRFAELQSGPLKLALMHTNDRFGTTLPSSSSLTVHSDLSVVVDVATEVFDGMWPSAMA